MIIYFISFIFSLSLTICIIYQDLKYSHNYNYYELFGLLLFSFIPILNAIMIILQLCELGFISEERLNIHIDNFLNKIKKLFK